MPARGSSFQRTEVLVLLLAFPLLGAGCAPRQVWGTPESQLRVELAQGNYAALAQVDLTVQDPAQCLALSPSAPYYLSFVFDFLDRPREALLMLQTAWRRSPSPWREEAGLLLARADIERKNPEEAIRIARQVDGARVADEIHQQARRLLVEALYWARQDEAVLREADRLADPDAEVLLFRGVSSLRLGLPSARDLVVELFLKERASPLHSRVYAFLLGAPAYLQRFGELDQDLLAGKNALVQGDGAHAIPLIGNVAFSVAPELITDGALVNDLAVAYLSAGRMEEGARAMERLAGRLSGQARTDSEEQAGRLYRRAGDYPRALGWLRAAAADASSPAQQDRARRMILDVLLTTDPPDLPALVAREAPSWNSPDSFVDPLQHEIAELISARRWETLRGLWAALEHAGPPSVRAQLSYVIARERQQGAMRPARGLPDLEASALLRDAEFRDPMGYYGILAASMLGDLPDKAVPATMAGSPPDAQPLDPLAMGFLSYGLGARAYARLVTSRATLGEAELGEAARRFAEAGDTRGSINLVGAIARMRRLTLPELRLYYPRAFGELIEPLARQAGIPEHLLFGLVREESYFDPRVESAAGAVGLSQLMPSTAASVAQKLRLVDPDLADPATNLAIGVRHLRDLMAAAGSMTGALLAYNAGLSRLRQWQRANPGLPEDLLVESAAIAETRDYVRKILVSSVMYAFLYRDVDPRDAALSFFSLSPIVHGR